MKIEDKIEKYFQRKNPIDPLNINKEPLMKTIRNMSDEERIRLFNHFNDIKEKNRLQKLNRKPEGNLNLSEEEVEDDEDNEEDIKKINKRFNIKKIIKSIKTGYDTQEDEE